MNTAREPRPNRRYRRLIPAALTVAALSIANSGVAHAATHRPAPRPPAHVRAAADLTAVVPSRSGGQGESPAKTAEG
jgi:hypothetical protein